MAKSSGLPSKKVESIVSIQNLHLTFLQSNLVWEDPEANQHHFENLVKNSPPETDLIILPEMFSTGFSMNAASLAQEMTGQTVCWMQKRAQELNLHVVGSAIITENDSYFNRLIWATPDQQLFTYDKKHLFRYAGEDQIYTPGEHHLTITLKKWRIRPFICYDLRFPIWTRNLNNDYDVAVFVANWPAKRSAHWRKLLVARAIENQCYVIGVNRVGRDGNALRYSGDSLAVSPEGEILADAGDGEGILNVALSAEVLEAYRRNFPAWKDADMEMVQAVSSISGG